MKPPCLRLVFNLRNRQPLTCLQAAPRSSVSLLLTSAGSGFEERSKQKTSLVTMVTDTLGDRKQTCRVSLREVYHSQHLAQFCTRIRFLALS